MAQQSGHAEQHDTTPVNAKGTPLQRGRLALAKGNSPVKLIDREVLLWEACFVGALPPRMESRRCRSHLCREDLERVSPCSRHPQHARVSVEAHLPPPIDVAPAVCSATSTRNLLATSSMLPVAVPTDVETKLRDFRVRHIGVGRVVEDGSAVLITFKLKRDDAHTRSICRWVEHLQTPQWRGRLGWQHRCRWCWRQEASVLALHSEARPGDGGGDSLNSRCSPVGAARGGRRGKCGRTKAGFGLSKLGRQGLHP
mmetsp:Transcript_48274/g.122571  ORF Transcript_48274/g.122571 Transcript_48274/m.122571 type:complete len:255 (-) Transcript_48274:328-1092(-)